jgi:hypothetical protein
MYEYVNWMPVSMVEEEKDEQKIEKKIIEIKAKAILWEASVEELSLLDILKK